MQNVYVSETFVGNLQVIAKGFSRRFDSFRAINFGVRDPEKGQGSSLWRPFAFILYIHERGESDSDLISAVTENPTLNFNLSRRSRFIERVIRFTEVRISRE